MGKKTLLYLVLGLGLVAAVVFVVGPSKILGLFTPAPKPAAPPKPAAAPVIPAAVGNTVAGLSSAAAGAFCGPGGAQVMNSVNQGLYGLGRMFGIA